MSLLSSQEFSLNDFALAAAELQNRLLDGLAMIRVTETQAEVLRDQCGKILLVGSNRAMKSVTAVVRMASIARDKPVTTMSGEKIFCRRPDQRGRPLRIWIIGDYAKHIGQTLHRLLFEDRVFEMVKDKDTGVWRSWNPVLHPSDWDIPSSERKFAPPMIPQSEIEGNIIYENAGKKEWTACKLKNGTELYAYASSGEVKQGEAVDEIWIDEQLVFDRYFSEYAARLQDRNGRLFWSTIHRDESSAFQLFEERAELQAREVESGERKPEEVTARLHRLTVADNPFIPEEAKKEFAESTMGERDYKVRVLGIGSRDSILIYPEYSPHFHVVDYENEGLNDAVTEAMRKNNWRPPQDWTRELILDPGTEKPGILFGAVPPPEMWDHGEPYYIVYDEIFVRKQDAYQLAKRVREKEGGFTFERFIIDGQAARQKPMGFSHTIGAQYSRAFESEGLRSRQTGHAFIPGDPDFVQRSGRVRSALRVRPCSRPQLRIVGHQCPELVIQMKRNVRKTDREGNPLEAELENQINDLRVCVEYWLSRHPQYVEPPVSDKLLFDPGYQQYLAKKKFHEQFHKQAPSSEDRSVNVGAVSVV